MLPVEQRGTAGVESGRARILDDATQHVGDQIRMRYENPFNAFDKREYHVSNHTFGVMTRVGMILETVRTVDPSLITPEQIEIAKVAALFHDISQYGRTIDCDFANVKTKKLKWLSGENEYKSAEEFNQFMLFRGFNEGEIKDGYEGILTTEAAFDPKSGTMIQPRLNSSSSLTAFAIALADLGAAGMGSTDEFEKAGLAVFREEFFEVKNELSDFYNIGPAREDELQYLMIRWLEGQVEFAKGRKVQTSKDVSHLSEELQDRLLKLFPHFDNNIKYMKKRAKEARSMRLVPLAKRFGYEIPQFRRVA